MSVHRRGDRWVAKVWADGGWRWIGTYSTRKQARAAEQAARPSCAWGITVDDFCERWLRDYARPALSTRRNNRYSLNSFRREFGSRRLDSIERPEAQRWALRVPYASYRTVRTMYADALRDGVVADNPFSRLRIPAPHGRRRLDVLSEAEVLELADCALEVHDEPVGATVRAAIPVAGFAGLRAGEIGGLEWGDVDLRRGELHVVRSIAPEGIKPPKNGEPRICVVPPPAADALADLDRHADQPAVFLTPRGRRFGRGRPTATSCRRGSPSVARGCNSTSCDTRARPCSWSADLPRRTWLSSWAIGMAVALCDGCMDTLQRTGPASESRWRSPRYPQNRSQTGRGWGIEVNAEQALSSGESLPLRLNRHNCWNAP